jgi:hypothetical protein
LTRPRRLALGKVLISTGDGCLLETPKLGKLPDQETTVQLYNQRYSASRSRVVYFEVLLFPIHSSNVILGFRPSK